eukprot:3007392-Prymnesium_polylepis.1
MLQCVAQGHHRALAARAAEDAEVDARLRRSNERRPPAAAVALAFIVRHLDRSTGGTCVRMGTTVGLVEVADAEAFADAEAHAGATLARIIAVRRAVAHSEARPQSKRAWCNVCGSPGTGG